MNPFSNISSLFTRFKDTTNPVFNNLDTLSLEDSAFLPLFEHIKYTNLSSRKLSPQCPDSLYPTIASSCDELPCKKTYEVTDVSGLNWK